MGSNRSLLLTALALASCAAPVRLDGADWRPRVRDMSVPPSVEVVDAAAPLPLPAALPAALLGPQLVRSVLRYELTRGDEDVWEIRLKGPEHTVQRVDSWASVTLTSPGSRGSALVKSARVYSGLINIAPRGEETEDSLLLLPLAFMGDSLFHACETLGPMDPEEFKRETNAKSIRDAYIGASLAGFGASFTVQRSPEIAALMSSVMQWPGNWLGRDKDAPVTLRPDTLSAEPCTTSFGPGWRVPIEILAGDTQAFVGEVTVIDPKGALNLAAGIVEAVGLAPDRPDDVIRLKLVGAHAPRTDQLAPEAIESLLEIKPREKNKRIRLR